MSKREHILREALRVFGITSPNNAKMSRRERHEFKMRAVFELVLNQYLPPDAEEQA